MSSRRGELRVGLLGPGRRRNGLGPYLASWAERAGARLVAAAGRDAARTRADCAALEERLGHAVAPHADAHALLAAERLDALIVATPAAAHLDGLRAALDHGVAALGEKPLLPAGHGAARAALLAGFAARGLLLEEIVQWPEVLPGFATLYPSSVVARGGVPGAVAMRLSPSQPGRAGLHDSLSHLLSIVQAVAPVGPATGWGAVSLRESGAGSVLEARLGGPFPPLAVRLELVPCPTQPRPAWIEIDGDRAERVIEAATYSMALAAADGAVPVADPLGSYVERFLCTLRTGGPAAAAAARARIADRGRLYDELLAALP